MDARRQGHDVASVGQQPGELRRREHAHAGDDDVERGLLDPLLAGMRIGVERAALDVIEAGKPPLAALDVRRRRIGGGVARPLRIQPIEQARREPAATGTELEDADRRAARRRGGHGLGDCFVVRAEERVALDQRLRVAAGLRRVHLERVGATAENVRQPGGAMHGDEPVLAELREILERARHLPRRRGLDGGAPAIAIRHEHAGGLCIRAQAGSERRMALVHARVTQSIERPRDVAGEQLAQRGSGEVRADGSRRGMEAALGRQRDGGSPRWRGQPATRLVGRRAQLGDDHLGRAAGTVPDAAQPHLGDVHRDTAVVVDDGDVDDELILVCDATPDQRVARRRGLFPPPRPADEHRQGHAI